MTRMSRRILAALLPVALSVAGAQQTASAGVRPFTAVSAVTASISSPSPAAGAQTTYNVTFKTSASGALSGNAGDTITVTLPAGTSTDTLNFTEVTVAGTQVGACSESSATVARCGLFGGDSIAANTTVAVLLGGVTNPNTAGSYKLSVATSKDTTAVNSPSYTVTAVGKVSAVSVALAPTAAAGAQTSYTVSFTTSSTGGLAEQAGSRITVTFPAGTNVSTLVLTEVSVAGTQVGACSELSATQVSCGLFGGESVAANTAVSIELGGVTNPATAKSYTLSVATTSDTTAVASPSYAVTAAKGVTGLSVAIAPTSAAGAQTTYTLSLSTSATGGLSSDSGSKITVTFPAGTNVSTLVSSEVLVAGNEVGACGELSATMLSCGLFGGETVPGSTAVTLLLGGVTNPATAKSYTLSVATTSDTKPATSPSYPVTAAGKIKSLKLALSSTLTKATGVTYTAQFTTDTGMSSTSGSSINLTFSSSTGLSGLTSTVVTVGGTQVGACSTRSTTLVTCGLFGDETIAAGATVMITLTGITNPGATKSYPLKVTTTSDVKAVTAHYCVAAASVPCIAKVAPASGAVGTAVTITGLNLANASAVDFNGTAAAISSNTATKIVTAVPAGATSGSITVTTPHGTATSPSTFMVTG